MDDRKTQEDFITVLDEVRRPHNVVAAFSSIEAARDAILALERVGVPPQTISLLGASKHDGTVDSPEVKKTAAAGAATGALTLGGLGALGALAIPGVGPFIAGGLALAGALGGAVAGGVGNLGDSEAWRQTFATATDGNLAVGVHSNDSADVTKAYDVLNDMEHLAINRFDS